MKIHIDTLMQKIEDIEKEHRKKTHALESKIYEIEKERKKSQDKKLNDIKASKEEKILL